LVNADLVSSSPDEAQLSQWLRRLAFLGSPIPLLAFAILAGGPAALSSM
jgi:hypothetical protein